MVPQTYIFIGRSGCGKGTQAKLLEKYLSENDDEKRQLFYLEMGSGFRNLSKMLLTTDQGNDLVGELH